MSDPVLTTCDMAEFLGVTREYIRAELADGRMVYENVSRVPERRRYRVRLSEFRRYLQARGYRRLPTVEDFDGDVTDGDVAVPSVPGSF